MEYQKSNLINYELIKLNLNKYIKNMNNLLMNMIQIVY